MQPHPPQLPTDGVAVSSPKRWQKPVLWFVVVVALLAALIAFILPKKLVQGQNAPPVHEHRAQSPGFNNPTR
jgi:hypothetical protein